MVTPDTLCPECHGTYELLYVKSDRLVKRCLSCGHRWNEEHELPVTRGASTKLRFLRNPVITTLVSVVLPEKSDEVIK